ncbi:ATP-binding protein, partial [Protofrankia symbiont of Coriaria ruscifolia]|uniref:ATP-binding protein n=1 Tax=Protofrankia symbiont of Coriaria ruscifolia TaxID=1306542 RepID=UPI0013EF8A03
MELIYQVRADSCAGCGACLLTCPEHALQPGPPRTGGGRPPLVLAGRCSGCGECAEICPVDAIDAIDAVNAADTVMPVQPAVVVVPPVVVPPVVVPPVAVQSVAAA